MLLQLVEGDGDGLFQLRIVAFTDSFGILVNDHIGIDAVVFNIPIALG